MNRFPISLTLSLTAAALAFSSCKSLPGKKDKDGDAPAAETDKDKAKRSAAESAWMAECAKLGDSAGTVAGRDGWLFEASQLKTVGQGGSTSAAVSAISDYARQLRGRGIDLIVVPIPAKPLIYPDKVSRSAKVPVKSRKPARLDSSFKEAMEALESKNVRVVDLMPVLLAQRDTKAGTAYPRTGPSLAPFGIQAAVKEIGEAVKKSKAGSRAGSSSGIVAEPGTLTFTGGLAAGMEGVKAETLPTVTVGRISGDKQKSLSFGTSGGSMLLIGGSELYAWRESDNPPGSKGAFASIAEQLAAELQMIPDVISGGTEAKNSSRMRIMRDRTNGHGTLSSTKAVVWVFPATDLYSSNWQHVPLELQFSEAGPDIQLR